LGFYRKLLGTCCDKVPINPSILSSSPLISREQANGLVKAISAQEIKALWGIRDEKAPGPNGFFAYFFKKAWSSMGDHCQVVLEFFSCGKLLKQINHFAIVLVPKSNHAKSVGDHLLIACCNIIYKVIAKILAFQMEPLLGSVVDHAESTFIHGRNLADNVQLAQELLKKYARKRSSPRCLIKVDLHKAYDFVSLSFLQQVLEGLGFLLLFTSWVLECVSMAAYSLIINGNMWGFSEARGA